MALQLGRRKGNTSTRPLRALGEWARGDRAACYAPWLEALYILPAHPRLHLLSDLCALIPVLVALGGAEAMREVFRAIRDVGQWWP